MNETHTPGPWKALKGYDGDKNRCAVVADADHEWLIAVVENGQPGDCVATEKATAHLIAAAPDYHAAVESIRHSVQEECGYVAIPRDLYEALLAAHAKAQVRP